MQYPDNLTNVVKSISGWSMNTAKLSPQSLTVANSSDLITFSLPTNVLFDPSSFLICADIQTRRGGDLTGDSAILPQHTSSLVESVSVSLNGTAIDASCQSYGQLAKILYDFQANDRKEANNVLHNGALKRVSANDEAIPRVNCYVASKKTGVTAFTGANSSPFSASRNALPICISNFHGFLSCGKWIDSSITGEFMVTVRLASRFVIQGQPSGTTIDTCDYQLQNIRAYVNVASLDDNVYYAATNARLEQAPIMIPYHRYYSFSGPAVTGSASVRFSVASGSIDAAFATLIPADVTSAASRVCRNDATSVTPFPVLPQTYFRRLARHPTSAATGSVLNTQFQLGSVLYPMFAADPVDAYHLVLNAFRQFQNGNAELEDSLSLETFVDEFWLFAYRWSHGTDLSYRSGLDSRGASLDGSLQITATGSLNQMPLIFVQTTAMLQIGKFRSVAVQS